MFCPKCGKADNAPETYCRQCRIYLFDFDKPVKRRTKPEDHIKANAVLSLMTAIASLTLSILLFSMFLGREDTPVIIYVTAGFLIAMTAWQVQTFWRTMLLKKHFRKQKPAAETTEEQNETPSLQAKTTNDLLPEADFENYVPAGVVERTTRKLKSGK
jgi:hypothetical protein